MYILMYTTQVLAILSKDRKAGCVIDYANVLDIK